MKHTEDHRTCLLHVHNVVTACTHCAHWRLGLIVESEFISFLSFEKKFYAVISHRWRTTIWLQLLSC